MLIDTGGFDPESDDPMQEGIARQVKLALEEADVVVCVLDASTVPLPADREAVKLLRRAQKPVLFVANKCDSAKRIERGHHLYELGIDTFFPVSALHGRGIGELEEALAQGAAAAQADRRDRLRRRARTSPSSAAPTRASRRWSISFLGEERQLVDCAPRHHRRQHRHAAREATASATS